MEKEQLSRLIDDLKSEVVALKHRTAHLENRISSLREQLVLLSEDKPLTPTDIIEIEDFPLVLDCVKELFNVAMYYCNGEYESFNSITYGNLHCQTQKDFSNLVYELADLLQPTMYKEEVINAMEKYCLDSRSADEQSKFLSWRDQLTK